MKDRITTISVYQRLKDTLEWHKAMAGVMPWPRYLLYLLRNCSIMDIETLKKINKLEEEMNLVIEMEKEKTKPIIRGKKNG